MYTVENWNLCAKPISCQWPWPSAPKSKCFFTIQVHCIYKVWYMSCVQLRFTKWFSTTDHCHLTCPRGLSLKFGLCGYMRKCASSFSWVAGSLKWGVSSTNNTGCHVKPIVFWKIALNTAAATTNATLQKSIFFSQYIKPQIKTDARMVGR